MSFSQKGVLELLAGAAPSANIQSSKIAAPAEGGRWTVPKLRKYFKVELVPLRNLIRENKELQYLLDVKFDSQGRITPNDAFVFTEEDLEKAKSIVNYNLKRQWTMEIITKKLGYSRETVRKAFDEIDGFATLFRASRDSRNRIRLPRDLRLTENDLRKAGKLISENFTLDWWAPQLGIRSCLDCGTTEVPHHRKGLCARCDWKKVRRKRKKEGRVILYNNFWAPKFKLRRCKNCETNQKPHYQFGYCEACFVAIVKRGKDPEFEPPRSEGGKRKWRDAEP